AGGGYRFSRGGTAARPGPAQRAGRSYGRAAVPRKPSVTHPVPTRAQYIHVLLDAIPPTDRPRLTPRRLRLFGRSGLRSDVLRIPPSPRVGYVGRPTKCTAWREGPVG